MDDLVSRHAAIDAHCELCDMNDKCICMYCKDIERFMDLPTADLSEYCDKLWKTAYERGKAEAHPKKGKWVPLTDGWAVCSVCEHLERAAGLKWRFCPNCGARMEESDDNE